MRRRNFPMALQPPGSRQRLHYAIAFHAIGSEADVERARTQVQALGGLVVGVRPQEGDFVYLDIEAAIARTALHGRLLAMGARV